MLNEPIIRVAYADDHHLIRKAIIELFDGVQGIQVDIEAADGEELLTKIKQAKHLPDVCLLDISMKGMDGFETIIELKKKWPDINVLALSMFNTPIYVLRMLMCGAGGYLLKNCYPDEIQRAIISVYRSGVYYSDIAPRQLFNQVKNREVKMPHFTPVEEKLLKYCCTDLHYAEIAEKMDITTRSVEGHRDSLFKKLGVNSRTGLAILAVQFGLVPVEINLSENRHLF